MRSLHVRASTGIFHTDDRGFENAMFTLIEKCNLNVRRADSFHFSPEGMTAFAILAESHIAISTWPEKKELQLDFFCCGNEIRITNMLELIPSVLNCKILSFRILERDDMIPITI